MARFPMVEPTEEAEALRPVFEQLRRTRGRVPGMYRVLAHQPDILAAHRAYFHAALDAGLLPRALKEKIAFNVARLRGSAYCTSSHRRYALKHGVDVAQLEAIDASRYSVLGEREVVALEFAAEMIRSNGAVGAERIAALHEHFSAPEAVEIAALVGIMDLACTLSETFGLEPD